MSKFVIRSTTRADAPLIYRFIQSIAEYEKLSDAVFGSVQDLEESLFTLHSAEALIGEEDGKPVAFCVFFHNFSTFACRRGLYIEDIFVDPQCRGKGYGKQIFIHLAQLALQRGCKRMEWVCLDWNAPSIAFYKKLGAIGLDDWTVYRLQLPQIQALAAQQSEQACER